MTSCVQVCFTLLAAIQLTACATGTALFNGADLSGWDVVGDADWRVESGELVASGDGDGFLVSQAQFADFQLQLQFWVDDTTNSGVFIRCQDRTKIHPETCYELNIWDQHPQQEARTGAIVFNVMPPLAQVSTVGRWNNYDITAQGGTLVVTVNGILTAMMTRADPQGGYIALQHAEKGEVRFRNIRIAVP
jgi:hypothetical protein